ncbi:hypothetical protein LCGC14_1439460 [marine sediment metagenome]|uniref:Uncharacterized protein n=1 Tax=marine sediment metagenome TaxID=412755 RepID=A0A0F9MN20_9ZZZZ
MPDEKKTLQIQIQKMQKVIEAAKKAKEPKSVK